jgi:hemin uptake protein HemP
MNNHSTNPAISASNLQEPGSRTARIVNAVVDSRELLGSDGKVVIEHESMKYELRLTRQGKLILTK